MIIKMVMKDLKYLIGQGMKISKGQAIQKFWMTIC